jgi:hypothetical protein
MKPLFHATAMAQLLSLTAASVLLSACAVAHAEPARPFQSRASYEAAVTDRSMSPGWVLVTVTGPGAGAPTRVCTTGNFLIGAIMRESDVGDRQAVQLALANQDHVFHFTRQAALDNIRPQYSESDLADARALLAPLSVGELQHAFSSLSEPRPFAPNKIPREAIACALLERDLAPYTNDRSGQIYLQPLRPHAVAG